ncbi:MAG: exosortase/archaeosortase family protein [Acidobacteriales bacterium]|nr:exosortase/archaeosortase family protein [Terriglobales bacterium]
MASIAENRSEARPPGGRERQLPWSAIIWTGLLLALCYAPVLARLIRQWASDDDMGHGFFVPVVAGYIVWRLRGELMAEPVSTNWWGLALVLYGALQVTVATLAAELFLARTALIISLVGAVLFTCGTRCTRKLAFPLFLLVFMVPIPAIVYTQITFPLQLLASRVAEVALGLIGIPVMRDGNILELPSQRLSVVEACSGIRSLLSLGFLSLVYAYFFDEKRWMRPVLFIATVPIAIVANAFRVTLSGILSEYKRELAEGFSHAVSGWVIFMVALAILVAFHHFVNAVYRRWHARG